MFVMIGEYMRRMHAAFDVFGVKLSFAAMSYVYNNFRKYPWEQELTSLKSSTTLLTNGGHVNTTIKRSGFVNFI